MRLAVLRGDFAQGLPFRERAFDGCVSVSAAQWLCVGDDAARRAKLHRFFAALRRCLRPGARAVLQIYPDTVRDTRTMEDAAAREGCVAVAVTAHPHRTPNKKIFLCVHRDRTDDADGTRTDAAPAPWWRDPRPAAALSHMVAPRHVVRRRVASKRAGRGR